MENKLSQLTQQLYEEGLAKGRSEGEKVLSEAESKARKVVAEAETEAREIVRKARAEAEDLHKNTMTEIALAGKEAVSRIKDQIAGLVTMRSISDGVGKAGLDPAFLEEMILVVARNWNGSSPDKASLEALLPEGKRGELDAAFEKSVSRLLAEGVEVGYSDKVGSGFKIGEKNGGYYIGFSDENLEALLSEYLREKATKILFDKQ